MSIIISLALATICFTYQGVEECHPILIGKNNSTPIGEFNLNRRYTVSPGYGGDILQFKETNDEVYAIHRLWTLRKEQRREERIKSPNIKDRIISAGCINVEPLVYERLLDCCTREKLTIR